MKTTFALLLAEASTNGTTAPPNQAIAFVIFALACVMLLIGLWRFLISPSQNESEELEEEEEPKLPPFMQAGMGFDIITLPGKGDEPDQTIVVPIDMLGNPLLPPDQMEALMARLQEFCESTPDEEHPPDNDAKPEDTETD